MKKRFICSPVVPGSSTRKRAYLGRLSLKKYLSVYVCIITRGDTIVNINKIQRFKKQKGKIVKIITKQEERKERTNGKKQSGNGG